MYSKKKKFKSLKIKFLVVSVLFFLVFVVPLYSRPKVELSLSNVHPAYHEWYKRYDFNLTVNPSSRFGLRFKFGGMDFEYKEFVINNALYGGIKGLLYFPYNNVSSYVFLRLSASYDGAKVRPSEAIIPP